MMRKQQASFAYKSTSVNESAVRTPGCLKGGANTSFHESRLGLLQNYFTWAYSIVYWGWTKLGWK
jgi:hypothetical protein